MLGFLVFLILGGVSGCATPYQAYDSGEGYVDFRLEDGRYFVSYSANGYTSVKEAYNMTLRRVEELGKEKGYSFYKLVDVQKGASEDRARVGPQGETQLLRPIVNVTVEFYSSRPDDSGNLESIGTSQ